MSSDVESRACVPGVCTRLTRRVRVEHVWARYEKSRKARVVVECERVPWPSRVGLWVGVVTVWVAHSVCRLGPALGLGGDTLAKL